MAKFIQVSDTSTGTMITVNVDHIMAVSPRSPSGSQIGLVGSMGIKSSENYDEIVSKIHAAVEV